MDNLLDINPEDFGLPQVPQVDNTEQVRTNAEVPAAALQSSIDYNPNLFSNAYKEEVSKMPAISNVTQSYNKELFEKYEGTAAYSPWMDPTADNDKVAAENWTRWNAVTTGLSGLVDNAKNSGFEYLKGWARAGRALVTLDSSYLEPNEQEKQIIAAQQNQTALDNPIYYKPGTEDDLFSRQFLAESIQNAGFTLGTMGAFALETFTGVKIGKLLTKIPALFKAGAALKSIEGLREGEQIASGLSKEKALHDATKDLIENGMMGRLGGKSLYDKALDLASNIPILGSIAESGRIIEAEKAARIATGSIALTTGEITKLGAGGLRRAFSEWNFAASESAIEAGGNYGDVYNDLYQTYKSKNEGQDPQGQDLQDIRDSAMQSSSGSYGTNLAVLAVMNKIAFGNIFRKFGVDNKYLNLLASEGEQYFTVMGKKEGANVIAKQYTRGYFGALSHASDIKQLFGKQALARELGKDFIRGIGKVELIEGLQENIQEGTNKFLRKYYGDLYDSNVASWGDSFKEAVDSQLTKTGWKTFLSGAITGLFVGPVTGGIASIQSKYSGNQAHKDALKRTLADYNNFLQNPDNVLREPIRTIKEQAIYNRAMAEAGAAGIRYDYFNSKSSALIQQALNAKRMGTFDAFKEFLGAYGSEFDAKDFEEATGINVAEFGMGSPADFMADTVKKLDRYGELYEKYNSMYAQYFSIDTFADDPHSKQKYSVAQAALQDAIQTIAFNEAKAEDTVVRSASIAQNISTKNKSIGQSASSNFNTVTDHSLAEIQLNILKNEIKTIEETVGPMNAETKDLLESKKKELEHLTAWNEEAYQEVDDPNSPGDTMRVPINHSIIDDAKKNRLATILTNYYQTKNKQSGVKDPILVTEVKNVLSDINDYQKLSRDARDYIDAVNLLSDPENALKVMHSFQDARVAAFARLAHDEYVGLASQSGIFEKYVKDNPEDMNELLKMARSPMASLDSMNKIMKHLLNISEMADKENENRREKSSLEKEAADRDLFNQLASMPANIAMMEAADIEKFIMDYYNVIEDEDKVSTHITRSYVNYDGVEEVTHTITPEQLQEYFGDEFDFQNMNKSQLIQFASKFEQALYNEINPGENPESQAPEKKEMIIIQSRKLKNLVGKEVMVSGKKGTLTITEKGYVIEFEDGDTQLLGADVSVEQQFKWDFDQKSGKYILVDQSQALSLDQFPGLELLDTSLSEKELEITGINPNSEVVREHHVEYIDENSFKIDGVIWTINRDENDNIQSIEHDDPVNPMKFSKESAAIDPFGIASQYLTLTNVFYDIQNKLAEDIDPDVLEAGIAAAESMTPQSPTVSPGPGVRLKNNVTATTSQTEDAVERIMEQDVPDDIAYIFDRFITPKTKSSVTTEERNKLFDWAVEAVKKLNNLDLSNESVLNSIDFLSKRIINPISKKNGRKNTTKQPKKASKTKVKTAATPKQQRSKKGQPSAPANDTSSSIEEAKAYVEKVHDKMERETAVKIEVLTKGTAINLFTDSIIQDAISFSKYSATRSSENSNNKIDKNPFEDDDLLNGLTCNI